MPNTPDPWTLRSLLSLLRLVAMLVPRNSRNDWHSEWDAELRHRWQALDRSDRLDWRERMDLLRRTLGAFPDAAWLRRQFTADAESVHDIRHGLRMLLKSPSFTLSAVLILGLGMGATVSIAAVLDTLLFKPLPYEDADRVVTVSQRPTTNPLERDDVSPADFLDWRARARSFSSIAGIIPYSRELTGASRPEMLFGAQVTEGFFDALGMPPLLGRGFLPEEHVVGARRVVVITYGFWQSRFAGDPGIVNRTIAMDGEPWTIVGVLPQTFAPQLFSRPGELTVWTPKVIQPHEGQVRASAWWKVIARLAPGVTLEQAQREMETISVALAAEHPRTNSTRRALLVPMREHLMGGVRVPLFLMLAAVVLVLGIGCANVASLLLARGLERSREFAIRAALGAGRPRLIRQLATESLVLSVLAGILGVTLAYWILGGLVALAPSGVLRLQAAAIDGRILVFAAVLSAATALGFGLLPAIRFSRRDQDLLRERQSSGGSPFRRGLVVAEVAIALVLLVGAGLLVRSFGRLLSVDPGFRPEGVVTAQVFAGDRQRTPERTRAFFTAAIERMKSIPGVDAAGAVSAMPFALSNINIRSPFEIVGRPPANDRERTSAYLSIATPGYFTAMSIPLREGRHLTDHDNETGAAVAVISDALRRREWPEGSPVGRRIRVSLSGRQIEAEVVGVVGQIRHDGLDVAPRSEVFLPLLQAPFTSMTFVARGPGDAQALIDRVKQQIWSVEPLQPIYDTASVARLVRASVVRQRFSMTVMTAFALLALFLCASGIYGIISFTTSQRTREIGLRMALGADGPAIQRMVLREGAAVIAIGLVVGVVTSLAATRYLQTLLFEVAPGDPVTIGLVSGVLAAVGIVACYVPARRATKVDPLTALRLE